MRRSSTQIRRGFFFQNASGWLLPIQPCKTQFLSVKYRGKLLGDVPSASAMLGHFPYHPQTIDITGRSYRQKDRALRSLPEGKTKAQPNEPSTTLSASKSAGPRSLIV